MKIGDTEIPDGLIEDAFKAQGKKIVETKRYEELGAQGNELAKLRKVLGEKRPIDEIERILVEYEDFQKKNKTERELLQLELDRVKTEFSNKDKEITRLQFESKKRDVDEWFRDGMEFSGVKIVEPILRDYKEEFAKKDVVGLTQEQLKEEVLGAIRNAESVQKNELAKLGMSGISPRQNESNSFGGGVTHNAASGGVQNNTNDPWEIIRKGAASPMGSPLESPKRS